MIVSLDKNKDSIYLAQKLREKEISVQLILNKTITKALEYANTKNIENIIIIGEKEVELKKYKIKNLKTGKESLVSEKEILN